ncbi:hypothetical protein CBR_g41625 [Chara braunii]|uniref:Photosystem II D1 processing protein PSB27-H2, chloroplastic n=1 Tax=Chara braunii TaxID=69332 RepID=A0A388LWD5_CHABU|nr:hypothetical protein CBR_g41625 [Chara braunii]|eukprot:GBG86563.1 hypothetical protein CBR_g41625 [Chara braunii]
MATAAAGPQCSLEAVGTSFPQHVRLQGGAPAKHVQDKRSTWNFCMSQAQRWRKVVLGDHVCAGTLTGSSTWRSPQPERRERRIVRTGMLQVSSETVDALTGRQRIGRSGGYQAIRQPKTECVEEPRHVPRNIKNLDDGSWPSLPASPSSPSSPPSQSSTHQHDHGEDAHSRRRFLGRFVGSGLTFAASFGSAARNGQVNEGWNVWWGLAPAAAEEAQDPGNSDAVGQGEATQTATPAPPPTAASSAAPEQESGNPLDKLTSFFDPDEVTKSGRKLPKSYVRNAREVIKTLRESFEAKDKDFAGFRRTADPAREAIQVYLGNWRGAKQVNQEDTYLKIESVLQKLGAFYAKKGPRAVLPEDLTSELLKTLEEVDAEL